MTKLEALLFILCLALAFGSGFLTALSCTLG